MQLGPAPDQLTFAGHVGGTSIRVQFVDGFETTVDLADMGIDTAHLRMVTAKVDDLGGAVEIRDRQGSVIDIDSSVFRSYSDPKYAAEIDAVIADFHAQSAKRRR